MPPFPLIRSTDCSFRPMYAMYNSIIEKTSPLGPLHMVCLTATIWEKTATSANHKNSHEATSYFCARSDYGYFGGYDEGKHCGIVHVADPTVSNRQKMFSWGYSQLSKVWEDSLTDADGAYAELMASSYSSDQPDFTWLEPYEEKTFMQSWYPIGAIGIPICAAAGRGCRHRWRMATFARDARP